MDLFSQSLVVPQNLRFYLHRLADNAQPSTNILRVNALNSTSANSGGLIIVRLPMALVDLNSFAMHFETNVTDGSIVSSANSADILDQGFRGILPKGVESLISRLEISVNGLGLLNLQQYNLLFNLLKESHQQFDKSLSRTELQNEKDMVPLFAPSTAGPVSSASGYTQATGAFGVTTSTEVVPIHVSNWYFQSNPTGTATANIVCTTTTSQPIPCTNNGVYELNYAPVATFFGLGSTAPASGLGALPAIVSVNQLGEAYQITKGGFPGTFVTQFVLQYACPSGQTFTVTNVTSASAPGVVSGSPASQTMPNSTGFTIYATVAQTQVATGVQPRLVPNNNNYHSITDWLAFFQAQPSWVQTQMLGEVEVRITLAQNDVLGITHPAIYTGTAGSFPAPGSATGQTQFTGWSVASLPDFSLQNIYFSIRTCSFDNNFVDDMLHHKLSSGGEIEIPYPNYFNINQIQSGGSSQTRFSVNTQSLDKVVSCNRLPNFNQWYNNVSNVPAGMGPQSQDRLGLVHKNPYFCTYASNPSGANYGTGASGAGEAPSAFNFWQYQINNAFIPNYKISPVNTFYFNQEMYGMHNDWCSGQNATTPSVYLNSGFQMGVALDFMDSEIPRLVSGVDTRGAVSVAYLNQDANNNGDRTDIFTCFTSILRVGANQQVQVVY